MRRTRRLFLLAAIAILCGVGAAYYTRVQQQNAQPRVITKQLPKNVQASSQDWVYRKDDGDVPIAEIRAKDMERVEGERVKISLKGVELKLFHKLGREYDLVSSASAVFDEAAGTLFSEGEVEIKLAVPADGAPKGRLLSIKSSGVKFDSATGRAVTERAASFSFDLGDGRATGAAYDPATRQLELMSAVLLNWRGGEEGRLMVVETDHLVYRENEAKVFLSPWSRMKRESLLLEGGASEVTLEDGVIRLVETRDAKGSDEYPGRRLDFGAEALRIALDGKSQIEQIRGTSKARLDARTNSGLTRVRSPEVTMDFRIEGKESVLTRALASGGAVVESQPAFPREQRKRANRVIRSDSVLMTMRAGGEEIESMETHAPGTLDLLPNEPGDPARHMTAERMWLTYGAKNQLESFRAVTVTTRTLKPKLAKGKSEPPAAVTSSRDLLASFDAQTGDVSRIEQWNDFKYREGGQQASAKKAVLEQGSNQITLDGDAHIRDAAGSVKASLIVMHQASGDFEATGDVNSTRLPEKKKGSGGMLDPGETMQATASRMVSAGSNRLITYEGNAVLWQATNRLQASRVVIDRNKQTLSASGQVISQFLDKKKGGGVVTIVRAGRMDYADAERVAHYRENVRLVRSGMDVTSAELRAFLVEEKDGGSSLDRAYADGSVRIFQSGGGRTRRGTSEHAEYFVADEKVILTGGYPQMVDSLKGATRGRQLTYWANNDSLLVDGADSQPAISKIRRN
jgi:lipopolysaccharide export system protein LptA